MTDTWLRPFSPTILCTRMSPQELKSVVELTDRMLANAASRESFEFDASPLLANTFQRVEVAQSELYGPEGVGQRLEALCLQYARKVAVEVNPGAGVTNLRAAVELCWVNEQRAGDFVAGHHHDGELSGVCFVRVPDEIGTHDDKAGHLEFFDGRPIDPAFTRHKLTIHPEAGMIYLFPSWLQHQVYPFRCEGFRRSMNFNAVIFEVDPEE